MASLMVPPVLQSPRDDATQLYRAFKGFGCDTATVINILSHRDATQRAFLQQEYKNMYHEELTSRLYSELSGNTKTAVLLWMHDPAGRDATILRKALSGDMVDLRAATEVICSRTPSQLQTIKQLYYTKFGAHIERDIEMLATGDHQKLLLAYINTVRYEGLETDRAMVERDAKSLFKAGEKKLGTDEKTFIHIFSGGSRAHLAAVSSAYRNIYGSLKKAVKSETSGNFEFGLLTILKCAENPAKYFAKELYKSMKGLGTTDSTLIRIVVTRTEIDMQYIKAEYHKKFHKSLADAIHSETSSHYRTFLLSLVGS
ncbi:annexin D5-like [Papaver somniferum]|uniref:annexin D5-like n=1 Tax=Papaver somniferum TaxID=3469 RepID=UPI000E6FF042|nr:annexin D5-like [Papaver somniferum]